MKYYYIFQVYERKDESGNYWNVTTVEVIAQGYKEAEKQVRPLLSKDDDRFIRLSSIVPVVEGGRS